MCQISHSFRREGCLFSTWEFFLQGFFPPSKHKPPRVGQSIMMKAGHLARTPPSLGASRAAQESRPAQTSLITHRRERTVTFRRAQPALLPRRSLSLPPPAEGTSGRRPRRSPSHARWEASSDTGQRLTLMTLSPPVRSPLWCGSSHSVGAGCWRFGG